MKRKKPQEMTVTWIDPPPPKNEEERKERERIWDDVFDIIFKEVMRGRKEKAEGSSTKKLNES